MTKQKNTRRFSYDEPIAYQGSLFPSTQMDIEDDKGNVSSRNVFTDASGRYYTLDNNGNTIPIVLQNNLDEVTVTAPRKRRDWFNDYLTMSNDATKVFNVPHREYNPHLKETAERGAESHALWEKEHPNATAWGNALASVPFAVAATPLITAVGDAATGTAIGQYIGNGLNMVANAASNSSWLPWADTLTSSYFAAHGLQNMANGNFTPETALEVAPLMQMAKPMYNAGKEAASFASNWRPFVPWNSNRYYRIVGETGNPIGDAIESGVIRGPGAVPGYREAVKDALSADGNTITLLPKAHSYPMFSKGKPWGGSTARVAKDYSKKPTIIRSKSDTGPIVWEESNKHFNHKGHNGIYRPRYNGDLNAAPTKYFEYWEPRKFGYMRKDFPIDNNPYHSKEPKFISELDWSPEGWFRTRTGNIGYDAEDIAALNSHIPEYHQIEQQAKANGTWLKMPDGSTWQGDPRSWVQMMSKAYNEYTGNSPFKYEPFAHSTDDVFDTFNLDYFGKTDQGFYGKGFYTHPAENINGELKGRNSYGDNNYLLTTNVQKPLDINSRDFEYAGLFNWENTNAPKGVFDNYDSVYYGVPGNKMVGASPSELVVPKSNNYKSLLGNNGNFNALDPNMYKVLIPLGLSTMAIKNHSQGK